MNRLTAEARFEDTVPVGCECPRCGEARIDYLEWQPEADYYGEGIICATCDNSYKPPEAPCSQ